MSRLFAQRCFNHAGREAAARCPSCGQFYCRECIAEHDGLILCAACLNSRKKPAANRRNLAAKLGRGFQLGIAFFLAWLFFYWTGRILVSLPTTFHDASAWRGELDQSE